MNRKDTVLVRAWGESSPHSGYSETTNAEPETDWWGTAYAFEVPAEKWREYCAALEAAADLEEEFARLETEAAARDGKGDR